MPKKTHRLLAMAVIGAVFLTACGSSTGSVVQKVEGLEQYGEIKVITREEGSGTRGVFAEQLGLLDTSKEAGNADLIREDGQIAMDAEAVIAYVKEDSTAIGYVSLGALNEAVEGIKAVKISGVEADVETVADGKYPLGRNFNIAYSGKLSDVESDFMSFLLSEGQEIVSENYTSVNKATTFLSDQSKGTIEIAGSTSVAPLMERLAEAYMEINPNAEIEINTSDSTAGLTAAMQGSCDFGMASRDLKEYEKELLSYETIARDGIAVIVNGKNPVEDLTKEQLADIFAGKDKEWSDINN